MRMWLIVCVGLVIAAPGAAQRGATERVSVSSSGEQGNDHSDYGISISADGRFVAFVSYATNLVPGDTNGYADAFVRDTDTRTASVSGFVTFEHLGGSSAPPESVDMRVTWMGEPFGDWTVQLAPDGHYGISLPSGPLTLSIKHTHWLRQTLAVDTTEGSVEDADFFLINGDAFIDNRIDIRDLNAVLAWFGLSGGTEDLNEDGIVGLVDLNITLANFGLTGDD